VLRLIKALDASYISLIDNKISQSVDEPIDQLINIKQTSVVGFSQQLAITALSIKRFALSEFFLSSL
jgi:hypothetical protein